MFLKRLAAVGAVVGLALGLSSSPASAAPVTTRFISYAGDRACLDFNADWGVWVFNCNWGDYQNWHWNDDDEYTALRQVATKLCLTLRNGLVTMKPCAAADQAALWQITSYADPAGRMIQNSVNHQCLARMANARVNTAPCTGGASQRWQAF